MGTVALWLVVIFALISAGRYLLEFWRGLTSPERERRTELIILPPPKKKPDALAR
jgi:hypothetical protein